MFKVQSWIITYNNGFWRPQRTWTEKPLSLSKAHNPKWSVKPSERSKRQCSQQKSAIKTIVSPPQTSRTISWIIQRTYRRRNRERERQIDRRIGETDCRWYFPLNFVRCRSELSRLFSVGSNEVQDVQDNGRNRRKITPILRRFVYFHRLENGGSPVYLELWETRSSREKCVRKLGF